MHAAESAERAAERAKNPEALEHAIREKLQAQRDFAAHYQATFPHGGDRQVARTGSLNHEEYCAGFGFAYRTVARWCERLLDEASFQDELRERVLKAWSICEMGQAANFMSESVEWYTPTKYIEAAREALGGIDLDPASNDRANEIVKAVAFFTKKDDGLERDWHGRVFVNPPYGTSEKYGSLASAFCNKAITEYERDKVSACVILVNSVHSQNWQAALYDYTVCFVDHRIQFISGDGEENKNPTFQNIFVYLGRDPLRFAGAFKEIGYVMRKLDG